MRLVFIYGPPASGKTTVGQAIAQRTDYSFFFNHATVPAARAVFPHRHDPQYEKGYSDLLKDLRYAGIKAAAKADLSIIFTLAYSGRVDDTFVASLVNLVHDRGGTTHFVQLHAPDEILFKRVANTDRTELGKVDSPDHLRQLLSSRDLHAAVPYDTVLHIDTSTLPASDAASLVIDHFQLPAQQ